MTCKTIARNTLLTGSLLLAAAGCARREEEPLDGDSPAPAAEATTPASPAAPTATSTFVQGPKIVAPIQVEVVLTPAAKAELSAKSETIVVEAVYGGDPTPAAASQTNEFGLVQLGKTEKTLPATGGIAGFSEDEINRQRLELIVGQPQVMFNVRSARKAVPRNLLACELYWNSVQSASAGPIQIPCRLLSEPAPPRNTVSAANRSPIQAPAPPPPSQTAGTIDGSRPPAPGRDTGGVQSPRSSAPVTPATGTHPTSASGLPPTRGSITSPPNRSDSTDDRR